MPVGWEESELFFEGLILKLLLAREAVNSFQLDGIANLIVFGHKMYKLDMFMWICVTARNGTKLKKKNQKMYQFYNIFIFV